jgi:predicted amidohydrolase
MEQAHDQGAALIQLGEGAICAPDKRIMSSDPQVIADADWSVFDWDTQRDELRLIAEHAAALDIWTIVGAVHRLSGPRRPHNSLYVIDSRGRIVTRYDERMLSFTKVSYMYTPGTGPVTFAVDGVRFGCALGMESVYPEVFLEYEKDDVDCVLLSSHGSSPSFALQVQGHASTNCYWVSYATSCSTETSSGIAGIDGAWLARCPGDEPAIAVADINGDVQNLGRPWRRRARGLLPLTASVTKDPRAARDML